MQGRKLGLKIINTLEEIGRGQGLYKIILDCSKDNIREFYHKTFHYGCYMRHLLISIAFYEKCGYVKILLSLSIKGVMLIF